MVARSTLKFFKARQQFSADTWGNARTEIEKAGLLVLANQCINVKNLTSKFFRCKVFSVISFHEVYILLIASYFGKSENWQLWTPQE